MLLCCMLLCCYAVCCYAVVLLCCYAVMLLCCCAVDRIRNQNLIVTNLYDVYSMMDLPSMLLEKKSRSLSVFAFANNIQIIGFSGKIGTGKNYVSEKLFLPMLPQKPTLVMALADHFKVDCCTKDGVAYERVFINKDEQSRVILQKRGTEEGRVKYGDDIWIRTAETWMRLYAERGVQRFIITDVRFPNEVDWVNSLGGHVIRIEAPERNLFRLNMEAKGDCEKLAALAGHLSETALDEYMDDFLCIIQNDFNRDSTSLITEIDRIICQYFKFTK
jgi:hypothetical protein